ncbi:MAG: hypothetical protein JSV66_13535 [Trueperaceae bacterium]|nr:MAG: hypothetical protein JSV66_13535 [Trueperaceae bacterium]
MRITISLIPDSVAKDKSERRTP